MDSSPDLIPVTNDDTLYETSCMQQYYYHRNMNKLYTNFIVAAKYDFSALPDVDATSVKYIIYQALRELLADNASLTANVVDQGKTVKLLDKISFDEVITSRYTDSPTETDDDLTKVMDIMNQFRFAYDAPSPLWHAKILNDKWIFVAFDHLLYDGMSGANFHIQLHAIINKQIATLNLTADKADEMIATLKQPLWVNPHNYPASNVTLPTEHIIDCALSWTDTSAFLSKQVMPTSFSLSMSAMYHYWYASKFVKNEVYDTEYVFMDVNENPPVPQVTYRPGSFDSHVKLIRISPQQGNNIKINILKKYNIRFSAFFIYIALLSLLPITLNHSTTTSIPTNVRHHVQQAAKDKMPSIPSSNDLFGCLIGSAKLELRSFVQFIPSLFKWVSTPPLSIDEAVTDLKALPITELIDIELMTYLSTSLGTQLNTPTSSAYGGLFHSLGLLQLGRNLKGLDEVLKGISTSPNRGTLEVSNLGAHTFNNSPGGVGVGVEDMLFSQKSLCPGNYFTANLVSVAGYSTNLVFDTIPLFSPHEFSVITDLLHYFIQQVSDNFTI